MRQKEIQQFKEELLERMTKLEAIIARQIEAGEDLLEYNEFNDVSAKNDETAEEISEMLSSLAVTESLEKTLKDVKQALGMIDNGDYGVCKYCKNDIPIARMRIRPVSTSCVECKSKFTN